MKLDLLLDERTSKEKLEKAKELYSDVGLSTLLLKQIKGQCNPHIERANEAADCEDIGFEKFKLLHDVLKQQRLMWAQYGSSDEAKLTVMLITKQLEWMKAMSDAFETIEQAMLVIQEQVQTMENEKVLISKGEGESESERTSASSNGKESILQGADSKMKNRTSDEERDEDKSKDPSIDDESEKNKSGNEVLQQNCALYGEKMNNGKVCEAVFKGTRKQIIRFQLLHIGSHSDAMKPFANRGRKPKAKVEVAVNGTNG